MKSEWYSFLSFTHIGYFLLRLDALNFLTVLDFNVLKTVLIPRVFFHKCLRTTNSIQL